MTNMTTLILSILPALAQVESRGNPSAQGDGGRSVGIYQVSRRVVEDVNRRHGTAWTLTDMCQPLQARRLTTLRLADLARSLPVPATEERLVRCWNGGPDGWRMQGTAKYWRKYNRMKGIR
jgi:hypothetical protein